MESTIIFARQKALELIDRFKPFAYSYDGISECHTEEVRDENAVNCAIECAGQVLTVAQDSGYYSDIVFWQKVEEELKKIKDDARIRISETA